MLEREAVNRKKSNHSSTFEAKVALAADQRGSVMTFSSSLNEGSLRNALEETIAYCDKPDSPTADQCIQASAEDFIGVLNAQAHPT
ncbi:hypothetical protein OAV48_01350 [bacterium]|nr:hypothetical protein [bacterium]